MGLALRVCQGTAGQKPLREKMETEGDGWSGEAKERRKKKSEEEARTAIRNKCAARLLYQGDRCIIIG